MAQAVKKTSQKEAIDIGSITTPKLKSLVQEIEVELKKRDKEDRKKAFSRMQEVAAEYGLSLADVLGDRKKFSSRKLPHDVAKYINPANPKEAWNGRGPRPKWLKTLLESETSLEELTRTSPSSDRGS